MATLVNLTYDLADLIGTDYDPRHTRVFVKTNITPDPVIVVDGTTMRLGDVTQKPDADGTGEFTGLIATNSAENPTSFAYRFIVQFNSTLPNMRGKKQTWTSSEFPLTATANIAAIPEAFDGLSIPVSWRSDFRDEMEAIRDEATAITGIDSTDSAVAALVETAAGPLTQAALSATIEAEGRSIFVAATSPEAYGAEGDGTTDDHAAIQAMYDAIEAAGSPPTLVTFKSGKTYLTSNEIQVKPDNVTTLAYGATILGTVTPTDNGGLVTIVDRSDSSRTIQNVQWHGGLIRPRNAFDNGFNVVSAESVLATDIQVDCTIAANRGIAIQTAAPYGDIKRVTIADCEVWGANGVDAYNLNANLTGGQVVEDISFRNIRASGTQMGVRIGCSVVGQTMDRIHVDGADIDSCESGIQWNDLNDSSISNTHISNLSGSTGAIGRAISGREISRGKIANVQVYAPAAGNMAIALVNGAGQCELSNVDIEGPFTVALYNGGTSGLTARDVKIKDAVVGIQDTTATQQAIYDGFTFENVTTQVHARRDTNAYRRFYERSGTTVTDVSRFGPSAIDVPVFGYYTQTNWSSLASKGLNSSGAQNAAISWKITPGAGTYTFRLAHSKSANRGIYTVTVDGASVGTIDGYDAATADALSELTGIALTNGEHTLTLTMATKHASSSAYYGSIFAVALARTA